MYTTIVSTLQADVEPHAEFHSSEVTSVPWLCFDITLIKEHKPTASI